MHSHYNPGGFPRICAAPAFPPAPKRGTELDSGYSGKRSIGHLGSNLSDILIEIQTFSLKKIHLKKSSAKWCPFGLSLNEFIRDESMRH